MHRFPLIESASPAKTDSWLGAAAPVRDHWREERDTVKSVKIYSAGSALREPKQFLRSVGADLRSSIVLAEELLLRSLRNSYRQSLLGYAWAFLPPVAIAFAFAILGRAKVINIGPTELPYVAFVVFNIALWQTFTEALNAPSAALLEARSFISRINFPKEALFLAKLGEILINFAVKVVLIVAVLIWYRVPLQPTAMLAPLAVLLLILLGTFLGLLLAPLSALYKDVSKALPIVTLFWMFMTPVVFPIPESGLFALVVQLNPVTPLLVTARELVTSDRLSMAGSFYVLGALALAGNVLGLLVFRLALPYVAERIST
jgi:lipopolysaccharide transport system permease protein